MEIKKRGRPFSNPDEKMVRMLRILITARQDRLLKKLMSGFGMSEAEHVRRSLDDYLAKQIKQGTLKEE